MPTFYALLGKKIPSIKNDDYSIIGTYVIKTKEKRATLI